MMVTVWYVTKKEHITLNIFTLIVNLTKHNVLEM